MPSPLKPGCLRAVYGTDNGRHFVNQRAVPNAENLLLDLTVATSIRLHVQFLERNPTKIARISMSPPKPPPPAFFRPLNHHLFRLWQVMGWQTTKANTNVGSRIQ